MQLDQLIVGNYRAFAQRRSVALRPITLLYGWNNAGKSALLRLLAMLGDSVLPTSPGPLDTSRALDRDGGFQSLLSKFAQTADVDPGALQIGLRWDDGFQGDFELKLGADGLQYVSRVASGVGGEHEIAFAAARGPGWYAREPLTSASATQRISFEGLVPQAPELKELAEHLRALSQSVQWLKATRVRPPRRFEPRGVRPRLLAADGSDAIEVLAMDDEVCRIVAKWYSDAVQRELLLRPEGQERRLLLRPLSTAMDIDLADTGEGMSQCLPVLVATTMAMLRASPRIVAFEEPESHLHPRAQAELARFICKVAARPDPPRFVLETHSFSMLLGIQLAIATGEIPAERVALHWIDGERPGKESDILTICFDDYGRPIHDGALPIFATESELANELAAKQHGAW